MSELSIDQEFYGGLRELADSAFPKHCRHCGQEYANATDFLTATLSLRANASGLKQSLDDDGQMIVDLFRNCACGSTLLESFQNRRDCSEQGDKRRKIFQEMVNRLVEQNWSADKARAELLKLMHASASE